MAISEKPNGCAYVYKNRNDSRPPWTNSRGPTYVLCIPESNVKRDRDEPVLAAPAGFGIDGSQYRITLGAGGRDRDGCGGHKTARIPINHAWSSANPFD